MINIAVDGPAGAGKSSISKAAALEMGFIYVDTGALYRSIALYVLENNINLNQIADSLKSIDIKLEYADNVQQVILNGKNVSNNIRTSEVSMEASKISALPEVRSFLLDLQKKIARENNVIMDGRDIGTVVLPNADLKIFLTASAEERANRRFKEISDNNITYEQVLEDIKKRDYDDMNRKVSPLKQADDAILLDTSKLSFEQSKEKLKELIKEVM